MVGSQSDVSTAQVGGWRERSSVAAFVVISGILSK